MNVFVWIYTTCGLQQKCNLVRCNWIPLKICEKYISLKLVTSYPNTHGLVIPNIIYVLRGDDDCFASNINLIFPNMFEARQCIKISNSSWHKRYYILIYHYASQNHVIQWFNVIGRIWKYSNLPMEFTDSIFIHIASDARISWKIAQLEVLSEKNIPCRDLSKFTWLQMIGYRKYTEKYV